MCIVGDVFELIHELVEHLINQGCCAVHGFVVFSERRLLCSFQSLSNLCTKYDARDRCHDGDLTLLVLCYQCACHVTDCRHHVLNECRVTK